MCSAYIILIFSKLIRIRNLDTYNLVHPVFSGIMGQLYLAFSIGIFEGMKNVYFVRHAKSSWAHPELSDHDRPLNDRGHRDAPEMARYLLDEGHSIDLILTSTAQRALTTAAYFRDTFGLDEDHFWKESELYHASAETLVGILRQLTEEFVNVAVFAHNPGMSMLANSLSQVYIDNVPTCGVTHARCKVSWDECYSDHLEFVKLYTPRNIQ